MKVNYQDYLEEAVELFLEDKEIGGSRTKVAKYLHHKYALLEDVNLDSFRRQLSKLMSRKLADKDIIVENVKLAKQKQRQQDTNRIERKSFREYARVENAIGELAKALIENNKEYGEFLKTLNIAPLKRIKNKRGVGVIQLSDPHLNELINLPNNRYDFTIASQRLKLHTHKSLMICDSFKVKEIVLMVTGDLLNSDRRLDELLSQATNRSKASMLAQHLVLQMILDIRNRGYKISIVSVLGNESRVGKEMTFSDEGLSDNYDFNIMANVKDKLEFAEIKGIKWGSIDKVEEVIEIDGNNWLAAHDINKYTSTQKNNQSAVGRYSQNGIKVDYCIGGHIHYTYVGISHSRSSSLAGSNTYNERALNLSSRAQQMCYICQDGCIQPTVIDVQDVEGVEGYNIVKELEAYNAKSASKVNPGQTIFKVVI